MERQIPADNAFPNEMPEKGNRYVESKQGKEEKGRESRFSEKRTERTAKQGREHPINEGGQEPPESEAAMGQDNKMKSTKNRKKTDGKFRSKHIKHDPQAESARSEFGLTNNKTDGDR